MTKHRIVSLIASATEIVAALGFEDRLVGRSHECDFPASVGRVPVCSSSKVNVDASSRAIDTQVRSIVAEALSVYRVDAQLLDRLAPTVIVTQTQCEVCAVSLADVERAVCELVCSEPEIVSLEPMGLGDIWRDIAAVATVPGSWTNSRGGSIRFEPSRHGFPPARQSPASNGSIRSCMPETGCRSWWISPAAPS